MTPGMADDGVWDPESLGVQGQPVLAMQRSLSPPPASLHSSAARRQCVGFRGRVSTAVFEQEVRAIAAAPPGEASRWLQSKTDILSLAFSPSGTVSRVDKLGTNQAAQPCSYICLPSPLPHFLSKPTPKP